MTSPSRIRSFLQRLANRAKADVRAVAETAGQGDARAALFAATPLIISEYSSGSSALALDWYEEIRAEYPRLAPFTPHPLVLVTDEDVTAIVADATASVAKIQQGLAGSLDEAVDLSVEMLENQAERLLAEAFRDAMTENVKADPSAVGWRRFARPGACKFCQMLAARGAVYTETTARFAAHGAVTGGKVTGGNCMCIAGPAFGGQGTWSAATPIQYVASQRKRTPAQSAALREYLNENYPDAPG